MKLSNKNSTKTSVSLTVPMLISCPALTNNLVAFYKSIARHLAKSAAGADGCEFVSGIGPVQKPTETVQLQKAVHELRPTTVGFSNRGGVAFYSILKATEKVPYDSTILLFTGRAAEDEDLALITSENLALKRCKVSEFRAELYDLGSFVKQWGTSATCVFQGADSASLCPGQLTVYGLKLTVNFQVHKAGEGWRFLDQLINYKLLSSGVHTFSKNLRASYLEILGARRLTFSKYGTKDPQFWNIL